MKVHYIQHVPFETLGSLDEALRQEGHTISCTKMYDQPIFPDMDSFDWLIVMGGPMGIFEESRYPWLTNEKHFIKAAIDADKTVLGICLGAQLIAHVLGAPVYPNTHKEIGWFDLIPSPDVSNTPFADIFKSNITAFHWHGDTFDIPDGAMAIGSTAACANQGFVFENNVIALQFHLETTPESLESLLAYCESDLDNSEFVQTAEEIQTAEPQCTKLNQSASMLIKALAKI